MKKEDILQKLNALHFSDSEAKTYIALLQIGQTPAGKIIKRTSLHRAVVYASLDKLIDRHLVMKVERDHIAHFQALSLERLTDYTTNLQQQAKSLVKELKYISNDERPEIVVYEGLRAYQQFWLESLDRMPVGSINYVAGSIGDTWNELLGSKSKEYVKRHLQRKIMWQMIVYDRNQIDEQLREKYPKYHNYRLIKRPMSRLGNFNLMGEETVVLHSTQGPLVIEVRSKALYDVFKDIFDLMWDFGKEIR